MQITQEMVNKALNEAKKKGYDLTDYHPYSVAVDLKDLDETLEDADLRTLQMMVAVWQDRNRKEW